MLHAVQSCRPAADLDLAKHVLRVEADAILALVDRVDDRFAAAVDLLRDCAGRVIVTGMGKSGLIGRKIAATLSSTGTSAFFLHPAEAVHGDLGAVRPDDVVVALSHSGETPEILRLVQLLRRIGARLIAITGKGQSTLAAVADVAIDCGVDREACPMNVVPTASTTAALAVGDALAMTLLVAKGFDADDFATLHPGGALGKRLLRVEQVMHSGPACPIVGVDAPIARVVDEMSRHGLGMTCVVDGDGELAGVVTDGDLRRHLLRSPRLLDAVASTVMTRTPVTIERASLVADALNLMERRKITALVVVGGDSRRAAGVVHLHDLWRTNLF